MPSKKPSAVKNIENMVDSLAQGAQLREKAAVSNNRLKNIAVGFDPAFLDTLDEYLSLRMPGMSRNSFIRMAAIEKLDNLKNI
jgi:hypothetical protein